jgi:hypothetical protein
VQWDGGGRRGAAFLPFPSPQIENRLGVDLARGLGDDLLQLLVVGYLGSHHGEIGVGIEVELLGHAHRLDRH